MKLDNLIDSTAKHIRSVFESNKKPQLVYHNLKHTEDVVVACRKIADHYQLDKHDYAAVVIASWFHDIGYLFGRPEGHEEVGAQKAVSFVLENGGDEALAEKVKACILATCMSASPGSLIEKIVRDADLYHLGTEDFFEKNKLVRKEYNLVSGQKISGKDWRKFSLPFIEQHRYQTDYAKTLLQATLIQNVKALKERVKQDDEKQGDKEQNNKSKDVTRPSRGIETMFRTTSTNHLRLSEMADSKANIMISVNSIMASILVSMLFRKLDDDPRLLIPAILFLATSLVSIIFAILVTRPNITQGTFTKEDVDKKRANLLFFGNFHKMKLKDYQDGISAMMGDSEFLYGSMTRDIYNLGVVLGRKYKMLRVAYSVFMFGFIISIIAFVIAVTAFQK
ncbi:MAG: DUF5706 domain-containing protein [Flavipsychrobacter sp.]